MCVVLLLGITMSAQAAVPAAVKSIKFKDLTFTEGTHGFINEYYNEDEPSTYNGTIYFCYDVTPKCVVTLKDGTVCKSDKYGEITINGKRYLAEDWTRQYENPWKVGTYSVEGEIFGEKIYSYNVNITPSSVKSIKANNIKVYTKADSYTKRESDLYGDSDYIYTAYRYNPKITITLKNGKVIKTDLNKGKVKISGKTFRICVIGEQNHRNKWGIGKHTVMLYVGGRTCKCTVTVAKNPTKITLKVPKKLKVGRTAKIKLKVKKPFGKTKFKSSNKKIAAVSSKGKVKAKKAGKVKITAINHGIKKFVKIKVIK